MRSRVSEELDTMVQAPKDCGEFASNEVSTHCKLNRNERELVVVGGLKPAFRRVLDSLLKA